MGARLIRGLVGERVQRLRPAVPALELVETRVGRDPVQPRLELGARLEPPDRPPRPQQRLLDEILGVLSRAEHPVAVDVERVAIRLDQLTERVLVTGLCGGEKQALVGVGLVAHEASLRQTVLSAETNRIAGGLAADADRHAVKPHPGRRLGLEECSLAPCGHRGVRDRASCGIRIAEHQVAIALESTPMVLEQHAERALVAGLCRC